LASIAPRAYNFIMETHALRKLMNQTVGFHPERTMPKLASQTLFRWFKKDFKQTQINKKVYVFCDEFTNYNDTEIGQKMVILIQKLGYSVKILENSISGRTYLSKGLIREAQKIAIKNVRNFQGFIDDDTPLIGIEPSAILTFRDEYLELVPEELKADAQKIARNSFLFEEWFCREIDAKNIRKEQFTSQKQSIRLHGHCHQKAIASLTPTKKALSFPANYEVRLINSGCCGMAGSFGYEKEHYEVSMKVGELVLFPEVRKTHESIIIVASGTSCRHQIKDGTNRESKHPVEVLFEALVG
jgi:Fe-S oxidoreductase